MKTSILNSLSIFVRSIGSVSKTSSAAKEKEVAPAKKTERLATHPKFPKVSVVVTLLNEAKTVDQLLESLMAQLTRPHKIYIVDGGSNDKTWHRLEQWHRRFPQIIWIDHKSGNRSRGRNWGISHAETELVAITDAGCQPEPEWLEELVRAAMFWREHSSVRTSLVSGNIQNSEAEKKSSKTTAASEDWLVVAGYYRADPQTQFEKAMVPYALVMPNKIDSQTFLPATRSMLLPKKVWQRLGGFDEKLSDNEDYAFARKLRDQNVPRVFTQSAVVVWQPRANLKQFWTMIFRFARGDAYSRTWRPKVGFIFLRYLLGAALIAFIAWRWSLQMAVVTAIAGLVFYSLWAIIKNVRHVGWASYWLPVLQLVSDWAVMWGTVMGLASTFRKSPTV